MESRTHVKSKTRKEVRVLSCSRVRREVFPNAGETYNRLRNCGGPDKDLITGRREESCDESSLIGKGSTLSVPLDFLNLCPSPSVRLEVRSLSTFLFAVRGTEEPERHL